MFQPRQLFADDRFLWSGKLASELILDVALRGSYSAFS
jgi:hypothetical protein